MAAPAQTPPSDQYEPVEGLDAETVACERAVESKMASKTAIDYQHVVWAYGIIWSLFAVYGIMLWRRASRQAIEIADLQRRLSK